MSEPFYKEGLKFSCQRCSNCCGKTPGFVYLSKNDLLKLCEFFKCDIKSFVEKYCRWADYYEGATVLALMEQKNYDCIFLENGCTVYDARPIQCSTYPFWSWMVADKETWNDVAKDCPGMNQGKIYDEDFIEQSKNLYDQNVPIKKEEVEKLMEGENDF